MVLGHYVTWHCSQGKGIRRALLMDTSFHSSCTRFQNQQVQLSVKDFHFKNRDTLKQCNTIHSKSTVMQPLTCTDRKPSRRPDDSLVWTGPYPARTTSCRLSYHCSPPSTERQRERDREMDDWRISRERD